MRALFADGVQGIPILNRTQNWVEAQNYMSQSFTAWAARPRDTGEMLDALSRKLERRFGVERAPEASPSIAAVAGGAR